MLLRERFSRKIKVASVVLGASSIVAISAYKPLICGFDIEKTYAAEKETEDSEIRGSVIEADKLSDQKLPNMGSSGEMCSMWRPFTLGEVIPLTRDVALFRFLLPNAESTLKQVPCATLEARFYMSTKMESLVSRHYTPISTTTKGYFDIIVRKRPNGYMTNHLFGMVPGDALEFRTSAPRMRYKANKWKEVGMIAGGTGITPMLQILESALDKDPTDKTKFSLVFCNRTEENVLLKATLDDYARRFPDRFRVTYGVDNCIDPDKWKGFQGIVTEEELETTMPKHDKGNIILLSGPDEFLGYIAGATKSMSSITSSGRRIQPRTGNMRGMVQLGGLLKEMGYENNGVHMF